jgi:hypothetical protein
VLDLARFERPEVGGFLRLSLLQRCRPAHRRGLVLRSACPGKERSHYHRCIQDCRHHHLGVAPRSTPDDTGTQSQRLCGSGTIARAAENA